MLPSVTYVYIEVGLGGGLVVGWFRVIDFHKRRVQYDMVGMVGYMNYCMYGVDEN